MEVVVLGLRCVGGEDIAQHILLSGHVNEVLVKPYCPVARCGDFVILEVKELIGRHIVRHDVLTVSLHHDREDETVEHNVVLSDEMHELCVLVLPPLLPFSELQGSGRRAPLCWRYSR